MLLLAVHLAPHIVAWTYFHLAGYYLSPTKPIVKSIFIADQHRRPCSVCVQELSGLACAVYEPPHSCKVNGVGRCATLLIRAGPRVTVNMIARPALFNSHYPEETDAGKMASAHDRAVLQALFNPNTPFGDSPGPNQEEELIDDESGFDTQLLRQVKELEKSGISAAEAGDLQAALQLFSQAIQILPRRASAYNNRAQALRLQGNTAGALEDLDRAVSLSGGAGRTACQALVQRGLLRRLACQDDAARADFERAAAFGSEFARQQAVALNPYAALCNKMLSGVINKLRNPDVSEMQ
ncbi:hypothetical protein F2P81_016870 [Scophthalmus maximus]|uniref:Tetratricopeptide repeat protein 36 n=1 Tax=Scophthalmus maximus TaxID=52904 RepID=A0A6A4SBX6_SCOMX|nr:hypothetical protein F2P81_016870 [Scophthalmus maximus]